MAVFGFRQNTPLKISRNAFMCDSSQYTWLAGMRICVLVVQNYFEMYCMGNKVSVNLSQKIRKTLLKGASVLVLGWCSIGYL